MTFQPWPSEFKKAVNRLGYEGAAMIYGEREKLPGSSTISKRWN